MILFLILFQKKTTQNGNILWGFPFFTSFSLSPRRPPLNPQLSCYFFGHFFSLSHTGNNNAHTHNIGKSQLKKKNIYIYTSPGVFFVCCMDLKKILFFSKVHSFNTGYYITLYIGSPPLVAGVYPNGTFWVLSGVYIYIYDQHPFLTGEGARDRCRWKNGGRYKISAWGLCGRKIGGGVCVWTTDQYILFFLLLLTFSSFSLPNTHTTDNISPKWGTIFEY